MELHKRPIKEKPVNEIVETTDDYVVIRRNKPPEFVISYNPKTEKYFKVSSNAGYDNEKIDAAIKKAIEFAKHNIIL